MTKILLICGGAGFIGSCFVRLAVANGARAVVRGVDQNLPVFDVKSMEQVIAWQTSVTLLIAAALEFDSPTAAVASTTCWQGRC